MLLSKAYANLLEHPEQHRLQRLVDNIHTLTAATVHTTLAQLSAEALPAAPYSYAVLLAWMLSHTPGDLKNKMEFVQGLAPHTSTIRERIHFVESFKTLLEHTPPSVARTMQRYFASSWFGSVDWACQEFGFASRYQHIKDIELHSEPQRNSFKQRLELEIRIGEVLAYGSDTSSSYLLRWAEGLPNGIPTLVHLLNTSDLPPLVLQIALSKQNAYDWLSAKKWYAAIDEAYGSTLLHPIMKLPPSALIQDAITLVLPTVEWERLHWLPLRPNWAYQNQQLFECFMPHTFKYLDTFLYVKEDWNNSKLLIQHAQSLKLGAPATSAPQHLELPKDFTLLT